MQDYEQPQGLLIGNEMTLCLFTLIHTDSSVQVFSVDNRHERDNIKRWINHDSGEVLVFKESVFKCEPFFFSLTPFLKVKVDIRTLEGKRDKGAIIII